MMLGARRWLAPIALGLLVLLGGCSHPQSSAERVVVGGDAEAGRRYIEEYGCGSCHAIPGVDGADSVVGPPLDNIGARRVLAGRLANTPQNMILWIMDPQEVEPGTAMPDMGVESDEARDIAAYLMEQR